MICGLRSGIDTAISMTGSTDGGEDTDNSYVPSSPSTSDAESWNSEELSPACKTRFPTFPNNESVDGQIDRNAQINTKTEDPTDFHVSACNSSVAEHESSMYCSIFLLLQIML